MKALGSLALAVVVAAIASTPASAQGGQGGTPGGNLSVTYVARVCDDYADVMANRARNDIMESLRDLGPDSVYGADDLVRPAVEDANSTGCRPITGWRFTLGRDYETRAVEGPWGSLARVLDPFSTSIVTQASVPELNTSGQPTGATVAGATTVRLTEEQARLARRGSNLWVQGGVPDDPVLFDEFPDLYGFAALRCSVDNLNGDNVEWISFPEGTRHAYCYAYYVSPPPTSGTIQVAKRASGEPGSTLFGFEGNLSYNPEGRFDLTGTPGEASSEEEFVRAATGTGDEPWTVSELSPGESGWRLDDVSCTSRDGTSVTTVDPAAGSASIRLGAGDLVRCTFDDSPVVPTSGLTLRKVSSGGLGTFRFSVTPVGGGETRTATATTTEEGIPETATPDPLELEPGSYLIRERAPRSRRGRWSLRSVVCDGERVSPRQPVRVEVGAGEGSECTFVDRFRPRGRITVDKVSLGGAETVGYEISAERGTQTYLQSATTSGAGDRARARGDSTRSVPLGRYAIVELDANANRTLVAASCNGRPVPFSQGKVAVRLTPRRPTANCTFVNDRVRVPPSEEDQVVPLSDLRVVKTGAPSRVTVGETISYRVTVTNAGDARATGVTLHDDPTAPATLVSRRIDRGSCNDRLPLRCFVGTLDPGESATLRVRLRPRQTGVFGNQVAGGLATVDPSAERNRDRARGQVRGRERRSPPIFRGLG